MFATAANRIETMKALIAAGAEIKGATKVVDLKAQTNAEEEAFLRAQQARGSGARESGSSGAQEPALSERSGTRVEGRAGAANAGVAGVSRQYRFAELVGAQGGLAPLHFAVRQGHTRAATLLLESGADINQQTGGDGTSPLLMAVINGHLDLAALLLDRGANPRLASENGVTPLYAALNVQWAPKALYPQPRAHLQQSITYIDFMKRLLAKGVDVNARLRKKVWYSGYNFDLSGVDEIGATPFWRAAYASDVEAMQLLIANGADPDIPTTKPAGRPRTGDGGRETIEDVSGLPPLPIGGPAVPPLHAAAGVGYGEGFAANSHRNVPNGWMPAVKYLVEVLGADVNARDHEGNTALHHAAARGDNEMILYLVSKGADVKAVNRAGETTVDMANGPVQRIQPFPETIALLEKLGAKNNHRCKSC
jgi:ankyrin repeat protein